MVCCGLLRKNTYTVKNSSVFAQEIKQYSIEVMVSFDGKSLFTSVPTPAGSACGNVFCICARMFVPRVVNVLCYGRPSLVRAVIKLHSLRCCDVLVSLTLALWI